MAHDQKTNNFEPYTESERVLIDQALHFVADRAWRVTDSAFFYDLVQHLGESLKAAYAFCATLDPNDDTVVNTLALYAYGEISENISYPLRDTPCENVIGHTTCCYVDKIQQLFPKDQLLVDLKAESYAGIPLWAADGTPLGLIVIMDDKPLTAPDLTKTILQVLATRAGSELERLQVLNQLRMSEQRFKDFAEIASDWFWEMDEHLRFTYFSERNQEITGFNPMIYIGKTRRDIAAEHTFSEKWHQHLDDLDNHRPFRDFHYDLKRADGSRFTVSVSGKPVFDRAGGFHGYRGTGSDITAQQRAEEARDEAWRDAERANRAKSEFLATLSHEFRTPLNAILGFSEMMRAQYFGPLGSDAYSDYANDIHNSGGHLLALVNDVLDIAAIEAGKRIMSIDAVEISNLLNDCVRKVEPTARDGGVDLSCNVADGLPTLYADQRSVIQIIFNLLSNAIKFTRAGGAVTVSANADDQHAIITVRDTGIGIPSDKLLTITEPFSQLYTDPHMAQEGSGLGLSIVRSLVETLNGELNIESEFGAGTTVTVTFHLDSSRLSSG